jgi:hypothetical protein
MKTWVLLLWACVAQGAEEGGPLLLTSGWQAVLEVPDVRAVAIADPQIVRASDVHDGHVTLLGLKTGQTRLSSFVGPPEAARVIESVVVVTRFPTLLPFAHVLSLTVDETQRMRVAGLSRVEVGDRSICGATETPDGLELTGRRAGTTTLLVWAGDDYRYALISVRGGAAVPTVDELDEELSEPTDGRVVLRVGERGIYDLPDGLRALAMKDETVAGVRLRGGTDLVFEGLQVGATHVLFWDDRGKRTSRYVVVLPRAMGDQNPVPPPPPPDPQEPGPEAPPMPAPASL